MREIRLHLVKPLLRANSLCYVDEADEADAELADRSWSGGCEEDIDDAPVQRHDLGFFLVGGLAAKQGFHGAPEGLRTVPPATGDRPGQLARIAGTEHLECAIVDL